MISISNTSSTVCIISNIITVIIVSSIVTVTISIVTFNWLLHEVGSGVCVCVVWGVVVWCGVVCAVVWCGVRWCGAAFAYKRRLCVLSTNDAHL